MADNISVTPGSGATVAADEISNVLHQRVKISVGADGFASDMSNGSGTIGTNTPRVTLATDDVLAVKIGEVQASPTANTVLDRLKTIATNINSVVTNLGSVVLAAGSAVIGKVGLQVGGSDLTKANPIPISVTGNSYEIVLAGQTNQTLGATGAVGDVLCFLTITPSTISPGIVSIKDGSNSAYTVFAGGATNNLPSLIPFTVALDIKSVSGAWQITTGTGVSVVAIGQFT